MTLDDAFNAAAVLSLCGAAAWFWVVIDNGRRRPRGCGRRGCRRDAGWHGCNHGRRAEGVAPGLYNARSD